MDVVQTLDGGRRNAYDPDEIEEEQRERERRNKVNAEFQGFVKRVQVWCGAVWMYGVPHCGAMPCAIEQSRELPGCRWGAGVGFMPGEDPCTGQTTWCRPESKPLQAATTDMHVCVLMSMTGCWCSQELWDKDFSDMRLEFDIPFRELGFMGVPGRATAFIRWGNPPLFADHLLKHRLALEPDAGGAQRVLYSCHL
jgi:hypothetical protein